MSLKVFNFWNSVKKNAECSKYTQNLIFERNIHLEENVDDDESNYANMLTIGLSPYNKMNVYVRIESRNEGGGILQLDGVSMIKLLDYIDHRFGENTTLLPSDNDNDNNNEEKKATLHCTGKSRYKIRVDDKYLKLHFETLMMLKRKNSIIRLQIRSFENVDYKPHLYNMLNHFCFEGNEGILKQVLHSSRNINKEQFISEICTLRCQCFDESFALEMMNNCLELFIMCVPLFIKAL